MIVVGWSPTREAARSLHDALSLAAPDAEVELVAVYHNRGETPRERAICEDLAAAINRRGFKARVTAGQTGVEEAGAVLLRVAEERGADLIAAGAFGHGWAYDLMIGAVTHHLLDNCRLPLLLAR